MRSWGENEGEGSSWPKSSADLEATSAWRRACKTCSIRVRARIRVGVRVLRLRVRVRVGVRVLRLRVAVKPAPQGQRLGAPEPQPPSPSPPPCSSPAGQTGSGQSMLEERGCVRKTIRVRLRGRVVARGLLPL